MTGGSFRAAVLAGPGRVDLTGFDPGPLDHSAVRVAVGGCGVCGSNLPVWEGRPWFSYPLPPGAPGHEGWGTVTAVGAEVTTVAEGDSVAFLHEAALAEVVDVAADRVFVLPEALAGVPFPGEALGCAFNVAARSGFAPGQTVAVVGIGFLGAVVAAVAARAGARVVAISRREYPLRVAKTMGASELLTLAESDDVVAEVSRLTAGDLCEVVVEAVGLQAPLDLAGRLTGFGGRLVVAGFHQDGPRSVDMQLWNWRGIDVINAHERDPLVALGGIGRAAAAATDWLDHESLYTHHFSLAEAGTAFESLRQRPDGFVKALVTT